MQRKIIRTLLLDDLIMLLLSARKLHFTPLRYPCFTTSFGTRARFTRKCTQRGDVVTRSHPLLKGSIVLWFTDKTFEQLYSSGALATSRRDGDNAFPFRSHKHTTLLWPIGNSNDGL